VLGRTLAALWAAFPQDRGGEATVRAPDLD
jgi:hypothetical protein